MSTRDYACLLVRAIIMQTPCCYPHYGFNHAKTNFKDGKIPVVLILYDQHQINCSLLQLYTSTTYSYC